MAGGDDHSFKRNQSSASEASACDLSGKEESAPATTAEIFVTTKREAPAPDLIRAGKRTASEAAGACDLNEIEESTALAATAEIIRVKKKEVLDLLRAKRRMHMRMHEEDAKPAGTEEEEEEKRRRRRKVVKRMLFPQAAIDLLMTRISRPMDIIPDDVLATYPQFQRDIHVICMAIDKKLLEYEQAIINQYLELGYAVDEIEFTDDEDEDETVEKEN